MSRRTKEINGITLIALVITIIVLLILAGVSIAMLTGNNGILMQANNAKIMNNLSKVDESIKLYKSNKKIEKVVDENSQEEITNDDLINDEILKEYVIEETFRPIGVIKGYEKLGIKDKFGEGYKNINEYNVTGENTPYIKTLNELNNVCAIDLTDGTLYYLENGKMWSISGKTDIANNYERVNADEGEWTFNVSSKTLTKYNGDLTTVRGEQQPGEVIIPNYYNGIRVTTVGNSIFKDNTNLTKIVISKGITTIEYNAFYRCSNLASNLVFPNSLTYIGEFAFGGCKKIAGDLIIPEGVTKIYQFSFAECRTLNSVKFGNSITRIDHRAFDYCSSLKGKLIIPDSVENIGAYAFRGCISLEQLKLSSSLKYIGYLAFQNCGMNGNLTIPKTVTEIGGGAFSSCRNLESLTIEEGCSANLECMSNWGCFNGCSSLKGEVILPSTFGNIGEKSFANCTNLEKVVIKNANSEIYDSENTFSSRTKLVGYTNSTIETYAKKYNRTFEEIK